jgi:hypothetical protein
VKGDNLSATDTLLVDKLQELISDIGGVELPINDASAPEQEHEILIGDTKREITSTSLEAGQASAVMKDGKIALYGNGEYSVTYAIKYFINDVLLPISAQDKYDIQMTGFEAIKYENPNITGTNMPLVLDDLSDKVNTDFKNNSNVLNKFYTVINEFPEEISVLPRYSAESFPLSMKNQLFVATDGNDENAGTIDAPLATIEEATKRLTEQKGGVVWIRGGIYSGSQTITNIVGTPVSPIIISAYNDEIPIFTTGKQIPTDMFMDVNYSTDTLAQRIPADARTKISVVNLYNLGWTKDDIGQITIDDGPQNVYINGKMADLARYPNSGEPLLFFDYVFESGSCTAGSEHSNLYNDWIKRVQAGEFDHMDKSLFFTDSEGNRNINIGWQIRLRDLAPLTWVNTGNIWYYGNAFEGWHSDYYNIESFDLSTKKMTSKTGCVYGTKVSTNSPTGYNNYYLFNAIEALDAPGEWFFDPDTGNFYIYKVEDFDNAQIFFSKPSSENTFTFKNCENVIFNGMEINVSSSKGIYIVDCDNFIVQGCKVSNTQSYGIHLGANTKNSAATYNELFATNDTMLYASPSTANYAFGKLTPSRLIVQNNYCHDPMPDKVSGIVIGGYLSVASHNYLEDCRISFTYSAECFVEYNNIKGGSKDVSDAGLIYLVGYYHHGNHIRYNYLHDWGAPGSGVYLDDLSSGHYVYYNIVDSSDAQREKRINLLYTSSGHYNVFYGNILVGRSIDYIHESCLYFDASTSLGYRVPMRVTTYIETLPNYDHKKFYSRFPEIENYYAMMKEYHEESNKEGYVRNELEIYLRSPRNNIIMNNLIIGTNIPFYQPLLEKTNSVTKKPMEDTDLFTNNFTGKDISSIFTDIENGDFSILDSAIGEIESVIPDFWPLSTEKAGLTYER